MTRIAFVGIVLTGVLLAPRAGFAQVACTREGLQRAVDLYIAAQTKGDTSGLPLPMGAGYMENAANFDINKGVIKTAMKIDHHRSLIDPSTCQTFTEVIVTDKANPYLMGTRLRVNRDKIAEIEILWTTTGDWLFNADNYLKYRLLRIGGRFRRQTRHTRHTRRRRQRLPRRVPRGKKDPGAVGLPVPAHRRRDVYRQGRPQRQLRCGRPERREHRQPPLHRGPDDWFSRRGLHLRRRQCQRRQRRTRHASVRIENGKLRYVHTLTHLLQTSFRGGGAGGRAGGGGGAAGAPGGARRRIVLIGDRNAGPSQNGSVTPSCIPNLDVKWANSTGRQKMGAERRNFASRAERCVA